MRSDTVLIFSACSVQARKRGTCNLLASRLATLEGEDRWYLLKPEFTWLSCCRRCWWRAHWCTPSGHRAHPRTPHPSARGEALR